VQEGFIYVQELQQTGRMAEHQVVLGRAALMTRKLEQAETHFQAGLTFAEQAADARVRAEAIWGLAALATAQQEWQRAMRLAGLASAVQEAAGYRAAPIERVRYEQILTAIHTHLDREAAELAWDQGRDTSNQESLLDARRNPGATP
jgi:hypothetical protein